jgi:hypothetical protein
VSFVTGASGKWDDETRTFRALRLADLLLCVEGAIESGIDPNTIITLEIADAVYPVTTFRADTHIDTGEQRVTLLVGSNIGGKK